MKKKKLRKLAKRYRLALINIGSQHPAWARDETDQLVHIYNRETAIARKALGAVGKTDDVKADWCSKQSSKLPD